MAFHTYLHSGDYVDEVFFYASGEGPGEDPPWYFRPLAWDLDDLMSECHLDGRLARTDSYGILYCLQGDIDSRLHATVHD